MKTIWDAFLEDTLGQDAFYMPLTEIMRRFYEHLNVSGLEERLRWREDELQKNGNYIFNSLDKRAGVKYI